MLQHVQSLLAIFGSVPLTVPSSGLKKTKNSGKPSCNSPTLWLRLGPGSAKQELPQTCANTHGVQSTARRVCVRDVVRHTRTHFCLGTQCWCNKHGRPCLRTAVYIRTDKLTAASEPTARCPLPSLPGRRTATNGPLVRTSRNSREFFLRRP